MISDAIDFVALSLALLVALQLNERWFFSFADRYRNLIPADRTLEPAPIAPRMKPGVYDRAATGALGVARSIALVIFFNELALRHRGIRPQSQIVPG